ncbi:MAG: ATP-grasp domain-containing protein [Anaerolineales bacterium]
MSTPSTLLFITSEPKGYAAIREAKRLGCRTLLLGREADQHADWPRESLDELFFTPNLSNRTEVMNGVSYLARARVIDHIFPLDDYEVVTAAALREHLRLPGMGVTLAQNFRDKLAMRTVAQSGGVRVPEFVPAFNYDRLREFMARVPGPWLLKPRSEASAMGIRKIAHAEQVWPMLDALGDEQSHFLMERYLPGEVFHVDALVNDDQVLFAVASQYGRPPMDVYHGGGIFYTRTLDRATAETQALLQFNRELLRVLGLPRGAAHAEYIRSHADGQFYFLECAARVGGANIAETIEYATGINLWAEWARIEVAHLRGERYGLPETREGYAAVMNCLAQQEWPDLSHYNDSEVAWKLKKKYHAGLILATPDPARLTELITLYTQRFQRDFLAVLPPLAKYEG